MVEGYLVIIGIVFFAWLFALVWQTRRGLETGEDVLLRPFVPVNLPEGEEAVVVAEGHGRVVYANDQARTWFGLDGGEPNLSLMAQYARPADTLHDLLARPGHAALRVGQRQVEAISHAIPAPGGERIVLIMRELTGEILTSVTDFDPLRALAILEDISHAVGAGLDLDATIEAILGGLAHAVAFDSAEITLAQPDQDELHATGRGLIRSALGQLIPYDEAQDTVYELGQGYTGWIAMYRQPLLIDDVQARTDVQPRRAGAFRSYLGVPLAIGERFVGTLELTHREQNAFSHRDLALLEVVSGPIAAALQAVRYTHDQARRLSELGGLQQIADVMSVIRDPEQMYRQLTRRIANLAQVEVCGLLLFNPEDGVFHARPPFHGVPEALIADWHLSPTMGSPLEALGQHKPWWYTNAVSASLLESMGLGALSGPLEIRSLALIPMGAEAQRQGLLLVANKRRGRPFDEMDMQSLASFASQAAVVIENAHLYEDLQQRARELGGLQQIAQAVGALHSPAALYDQITRHIAALFDVDLCGILLFDPQEQILVSQRPFFGLDDEERVRFYQVPSPPDSPVSRLWRERDTWVCNDLRGDPEAANTDLAALAQEVGMRHMAIATLVAGGSRLGILQVANRRDGTAFTDADARLLAIFAGQAAVLIDNARLYREMQRRTHEAEGLRAVTEIASQGVPTQETVEAVLIAVANLLESQIVVLSLVDEHTGELITLPEHVWGGALDEPYRIDAFASGFEHSPLVSRQPFLSQDARHDPRVLPDYRPLVERFGVVDCIQVPLILQDRSIGEMLVANRTTDQPFDEADVDLLLAIGRQIAAMIDRVRMMAATDHDLRSRVQELNALTRVARELSRTLELDRVLEVIRQEALRSTSAGAASVVLLADRAEWDADDEPVIEHRFGEGHVLRDLAPVERAAILRHELLSVSDYRSSEFDPVPDSARSALVVPIALDEQVTGLLHLFSPEAEAFDARSVEFAVSLTDQATVAIANARRYQEQLEANEALRVRAERMGRIFALGELFRQGASLPRLLEEVAYSVRETVGFNVVLISVVDEQAQVLRRTAQAGLPQAVFEEMCQIAPPLEQARSLMQETFRVSNSYFLPAEGAEELTTDLPTVAILQERAGKGARAWHPDDLLLVPLYGAGGHLLGIMSVDDPQTGRRPTPATVEALEIFANQAAFSIENYRLVERIQQEAEATRRERDRLAQLHLVASRIQAAEDIPSRLQVVADGIHEAGWRHVSITLRDEHLEPTALIQAGYAPDEAQRLAAEVLSGAVWRAWINDLEFHELKLGAGYYLRYNHPWVRENVLKGQAPDPPVVGEDEWHPQDMLYLPLMGQDQQRIIGIIAMDGPADGRIPTEASLQPFEVFASQAAAAIETTRLYQATVRAADQEQRVNEVMEAVSSAITSEDVILAVGRGLQNMVPFTHMSVALYDPAAERFAIFRAAIGPDAAVEVTRDESLSSEDTAIAQVFRQTMASLYLLAEDTASRERFSDLQTWYEEGERSTLLVPMVSGVQTVGVLHLGSELEQAEGFEENLDLVQRLANLSAVALENVRLFEELQERAATLNVQAERLETLNRVSARLAQTLDAQEIYRIVLEELQAALGCQSGGLMLIQPDNTMQLVLSTLPMDAELPGLSMPLEGNPLAEAVLSTRQPVIIEDVETDERVAFMRDIQRARGARAMLIAPVIMGEQVIGTIGMDSAEPRRFTPEEIDLVLTAANQAAVSIENARLFLEAQQHAVEMDAQASRLARINNVSTRLAQTLDVQEIYRIVLAELLDALNVQFGGLVMFESEQVGRLVLTLPEEHAPQQEMLLPLEGNPSIAIVRETRRPLVSEDVLNDPAFEPAWDVLRQRGTRSLMIVPLVVGERVIGTIGLDSTEPRTFTETEIELARTMASQASLAIEKARLYDETLGLTIFNQAVVESIQQGIVVLDNDLSIRRINRTMVERYGWDGGVVGQNLFEVRPDYEAFLREPVAAALAEGEPQMRYDVTQTDASGEKAIRNYHIYPLREGRQVTGIVLLVEDVTERARLEADLAARAAQMAALSEVSSQITATLEPDQVVDLILDALVQVIPYDGVSLWLRTPGREELHIVAARGYADAGAPQVEELIGLTVEIPYSPLFREMAEQKQVINIGNIGASGGRFPGGEEALYKNWLGAPLISKGEVVGVIALEKLEPDYYTALHEQLALTFANQAAVALDNAQLFQETRARAVALDDQAQRLALLNRVSLALAQTLDLENIFEIALREAAISLGIGEGAAIQIDPAEDLCTVIVEYPRGDAPPTLMFEASSNEAIRRVSEVLIPVIVERKEDDPLYEAMRPILRRDDVQRSLLVPLVVGGQVIGILRLDVLSPERLFNAEQVELAQTIASQAAIAVQNATLFEQTAIRTRELETLFESAQATAVTLDLDEVVRRVTVQMLSALSADACMVSLWDDVNNTLVVRGELSARSTAARADHAGDVYNLEAYPLRERALRERELIIVRARDADVPPGERELLERHDAAMRLLVPLIVNDVSIGLVEVELLDPRRQFKPSTLRLARALGSQAAISIENARLQTETRRTVEELYIINEMSGALSSANNLDELLAVVDMQLPSLTDAQYLYVALYDAASDTLSFPLAMDVIEDVPLEIASRPLGTDEFSLILRQKAPLLLAGYNIDAVRQSLEIDSIMPEAKCFLGVPLFAGDDVIGVLAVRDDSDPLAFTHNDQRILNTVGAQLGIAIQSTRLFQQTLEWAEVLEQRVRERTAELEEERQHIATLYAITTELATSLDMERLLNRALEMVARAVGATQGAILAIDPISERLSFQARLGWPELSEGEEELSLAINEGLAGWAILNKQSLVIDNVQEDPRWLRLDEYDDIPRAAMVALIETNEEILGVITLYSDRVGAFTADHLRLVTAAAHQVANAMNNAELYSLIRDQADRLGVMLREGQVEATKSAAILDSVADGVIVANEHGEIIVFNTTASRILGLSADEVLGLYTSDIAGLFGVGRTRWNETIQRWMTDPASRAPGEFLEDRLELDDHRVISVRMSPVTMGDQFLGTVSVFRDITREVEVDRLKSEFVATVSHELRTPMTSIKGYADLLLLGAAGEVPEQQQRFLEIIKQNADRLSVLVNDLLDISRIDQGRMELRFAVVDVADVIGTVARHLRGRAEDEKREMQVITRLPDDRQLTVWGDDDKVAQILTNLADNAFNYTPDGGTITLAATFDEVHRRTILSVTDTGIGIAPEMADRIFERFFRGEEAHELVMDTPGTGLGLAIVRELVDAHQGKIWFESEVGQGTTFYVELPSQAPESELAGAAEQPAGE